MIHSIRRRDSATTQGNSNVVAAKKSATTKTGAIFTAAAYMLLADQARAAVGSEGKSPKPPPLFDPLSVIALSLQMKVLVITVRD